MNNHWFTNYKADQEGPTTFRYSSAAAQAVRSRSRRSGSASSGASRWWPRRPRAPVPNGRPLVEVDAPQVIVASIKPGGGYGATIIRLFGAGGRPAKADLRWGYATPKCLWISNLAEERVAAVSGSDRRACLGPGYASRRMASMALCAASRRRRIVLAGALVILSIAKDLLRHEDSSLRSE